MELSEYQDQAVRTSGGYGEVGSEQHQLTSALSLAGEVGEFCNLLKNKIRHGQVVPVEVLSRELGDVLWYVADLCTALNVDLGQVALENLDKLRRRYPNGFSTKVGPSEHKGGAGC